MAIKIVGTNDNETQAQKELRESYNYCQREQKGSMGGYILITWDAVDKKDAIVAYQAGQIDPDFLAEFAKQMMDGYSVAYFDNDE